MLVFFSFLYYIINSGKAGCYPQLMNIQVEMNTKEEDISQEIKAPGQHR